jgi:hypothetical protein
MRIKRPELRNFTLKHPESPETFGMFVLRVVTILPTDSTHVPFDVQKRKVIAIL